MNKGLLIAVGGGALAWWWYSQRSAVPAVAASPAIASGGVPVPIAPTPAPAPVSTVSISTLNAIGQRLVAQASKDVAYGHMSPFQWNFYLTLPSVSTLPVAPDLGTVFPGVDLTQPMDWGVYWTGMSSYLRANNGLSGLGAYRYDGLDFSGMVRRGGWAV